MNLKTVQMDVVLFNLDKYYCERKSCCLFWISFGTYN